MLPSAGPTRDDVLETGTATAENNGETPFALVDIAPPILDLLSRRSESGLRGSFGDYRPPAAQAVGVGDSVQVTVWEAAAGGLFSAPAADHLSPGGRTASIPDQIVGRDGSISVPYAGRVMAAGRAPQQIEAAIVEKLRGKAIEPQAVVNVTRNSSNTVSVTGEVGSGARVPLTLRGDHVMDVIAAAGGFRSAVHETYVSLTRDGRTARVSVQALLANPHENIFVRPGDVITVERTPQTFTVAGATGTNAVVPFDARGITLEEAIGKSGGLLDGRADPAGIFVLRYEPTRLARELPGVSPILLSRQYAPIVYRLNMRDASALFLARRFAMRDKDIVYVSNSPLTEIGKVFQLLSLLTAPALQGAAVASVVK
jgi:polysaccharide biosynthesis/export protein